MKKLLKVCKIDSILFASFAMKQNVDFLGIHVLEKYEIGKHKELVEYIKSENGKAIILTKIDEQTYLEKIVDLYEPAGLQFHFEAQPELILAIRTRFPKLLLFGVLTNDSTFLDFEAINDLYDFLIYDKSYLGGTNMETSYNHLKHFSNELKNKTLLAGGIKTETIKELIYLGAGGFDIQSYFRSENGINYKNLENVCDLLKFPRENRLSVSLTDLPLTELNHVGSYYLDGNLEYHLDYSPGTLYSSFNTIVNSIEEKQQYLLHVPYSFHLFIKDFNELREKIRKINQKYSLNVVRIFVQYSKDLPINFFSEQIFYKPIPRKPDQIPTEELCDIKIVPSVFFKDFEYFLERHGDRPIISIIVPNPEDSQYLKDFTKLFNSNQDILKNKEIWFDRSLNLDYIKCLEENIGSGFNYVIGKEVIYDWHKINMIHDYILR